MSAVKNVVQVPAAPEGDALLQALMEVERASPDGCVVLRSVRDAAGTLLDLERVFSNAAAERVLGRVGLEALGALREVVETGQPAVLELPLPDRSDTWLRVSALRLGDGVLVRLVDLSTSKRSERERDALLEREHSGRLEAEALARQRAGELDAARETLQRSEKLAVAGQLAAGVGHEINNPLAFVAGNVQVALEQLGVLEREAGAPVAERLRETVQALEEARLGAERIRTIVKDLRTLARADETRLGPVDVRAALDFSVTLAMPHLRHRAKVERLQEGEVPAVWGNEARLGQVFLNLLVNAAQALPEGQAERHRVTLVTRREGEKVVVEVRDTGRGMSAEVLSRIFEPFFTTKREGEGLGLGLSICQGLIRAMDGELSAESEPGRGSTFRVVLPVSERRVVSPRARVEPVAERGERRRVLVIDDEPGIGAVMRRILGRMHEVVLVHSGREALALLEEDDGFDRVFCDLMMEDLTGMDLHGRLSQTRPGCLSRFVYMTGGSFTERAREFLRQVSVPLLDKPFEAKTVRALVAGAPPRSGLA